jgi:hypothetical protein
VWFVPIAFGMGGIDDKNFAGLFIIIYQNIEGYYQREIGRKLVATAAF